MEEPGADRRVLIEQRQGDDVGVLARFDVEVPAEQTDSRRQFQLRIDAVEHRIDRFDLHLVEHVGQDVLA